MVENRGPFDAEIGIKQLFTADGATTCIAFSLLFADCPEHDVTLILSAAGCDALIGILREGRDMYDDYLAGEFGADDDGK